MSDESPTKCDERIFALGVTKRHRSRHVGWHWQLALVGLATSAMMIPTSRASAADPGAIVALLRTQDNAVLRVGERLIVAGRPICSESAYTAGMTVQLLGQYGVDYRAAAVATLGLGDIPTVSSIAPGSSAATAELAVGDQIAAIDDHSFVPAPARKTAGDFGPTAAALDIIERALDDGKAALTIRRGSRTFMATLVPRPACRARFDVRAGHSANATSDGATIQVSSDLVADARSDGELAAILAHELAHNILSHPQRLKARERGLSVRRTEIEADRLSVYLLDAAGYSASDAVAFWSHWGRANDLGILSDGSHPGWKKRVATIQAEAAVISAHGGAGQTVIPPPELRRRTN